MVAYTSFQQALRDQRSKGVIVNTSDSEMRQIFIECNTTINSLQNTAIDLSKYTMYSESISTVATMIFKKIKDFIDFVISLIGNVINFISGGSSNQRPFASGSGSGGSSPAAPNMAVSHIDLTKTMPTNDIMESLKKVMLKHENILNDTGKIDRLMAFMLSKDTDMNDVQLYNRRNEDAIRYFNLLIKGYGTNSDKAEKLMQGIRSVGLKHIINELRKDNKDNPFSRKVICDMWLQEESLSFLRGTEDFNTYKASIDKYFIPMVGLDGEALLLDIQNNKLIDRKQYYLDKINKLDKTTLIKAQLKDINIVGDKICSMWETTNGMSTEGIKPIYDGMKQSLKSCKSKMEDLKDKVEKAGDSGNLNELLPLFFMAKINFIIVEDIYNSTWSLNGIIAKIDMAIYLFLKDTFKKEIESDEFSIKI